MNTRPISTDFKEHTISLIKRRGFLIDNIDGVNYLSDNSHLVDSAFLDKILREYGIGHINGNRLCFDHPEAGAALVRLSKPTNAIAIEMCWWTDYKWRQFAYFDHGIKVPVEVLEPNIAFYCKALSACGLDTISSCDGNHENNNSKFFVLYKTSAYTFWHALLWNLVMKDKFFIEWENNYTEARFNCNNRNVVYETLFCAADYLYRNRKLFRNLKADATAILTKKICRDNCDDAIKQALTIKTAELLNDALYSELMVNKNIQL